MTEKKTRKSKNNEAFGGRSEREKELHKLIVNYFSRTLKNILSQQRLTHSDFAEKIGLHRSVVSGYTLGLRLPDMINLFRLARGLGCHVSDLCPPDIFDTFYGRISTSETTQFSVRPIPDSDKVRVIIGISLSFEQSVDLANKIQELEKEVR